MNDPFDKELEEQSHIPKIQVTYKGGNQNNPWTVVRVDTVDEALTLMDEMQAKNLAEKIHETEEYYAKAFPVPPPPKNTYTTPGKQPQAPQSSQGERVCACGVMEYREGISKSSNKPYKGFFCPTNTCKPQFIFSKGN